MTVLAEHVSADAAVVGSGPGGIAAAAVLAEAGRRVVVVDEGMLPGGQIWRHATPGDRAAAADPWIRRFERSGAQRVSSATVIDARPPVGEEAGRLVVERSGKPMVVHASSIVLATGARERFLPFPGWTLPGIFGVGGIQALVKAGLPVAGKRVVISGSGPLVLPVAAHLAKKGAILGAVTEQAGMGSVAGFAAGLWRTPRLAMAAAQYRLAFKGTRFSLGTWVERAEGDGRVERVTLTDGRTSWTLPCDYLGVAYGLVPNIELARLLGCASAAGAITVDRSQQTTVSGVFAIGECAGVAGVDAALAEGQIAAHIVLGQEARAKTWTKTRDIQRSRARAMDRAFALRPALRTLATPQTLVCRCEDVQVGDLNPEWTSRQAKLYCRAGMGACQGRVCGAALHFLFGWEPDSVRAPIQPARVSTLAPTDP